MSRTLIYVALAALTLNGVSGSAEAAGKPDKALTRAAKALGASEISGLEFAATGSWYQFGQAPAPGLAWPQFAVSNYRASIDYGTPAARVQITRSQVVEPGRVRPAPVEQKVDQFVAGASAWNAPANAAAGAAPNAQPAAVEERRAEIWSTPQGFVKAALANDARVERKSGVSRVAFTAGGKYRFEGELNAAGEVTLVRTWIDNPVLGDTLLETKFDDYQKFGAVRFPRHIVRSLGGHPVLDLKVSDVRVEGVTVSAAPANLAPRRGPRGQGDASRRRRVLSHRRHAPQRAGRAGRSPGRRRSAAERGAVARGHRQGEGARAGQADQVPGQHARALRSLRRSAHVCR